MKEPSKIESIIFDIDGTLYSNEMMVLKNPLAYIKSFLWIRRYYKMRQKLRHYFAFDVARIDISAMREATTYNFDLFWEKSVEFFAEEVRASKEEAKILLEKCIYKMWIHAVRNVALRLGMRTLIGSLYRKNIVLGILSDFRSKEKIEQWNIASYFSQIMCTEDFATFKPIPEIFTLCCNKMGCDPKNTIYVGNSLKYDGIGAKNAGLIPVLFHKKKKFIEAEYGIDVVQNVRDLQTFFAKHGIC